MVWAYKQAFEAAAGMSYLYDGPFESVMISKLQQMARRRNRIGPTDFADFSCRTVLAMLKHQWIFEDFNTNEIWTAVLSSFVTKPTSNEMGKSRRESLEFPVLFQVVRELTKMGHALYPFCWLEFSEDIARKLAAEQVVMIRKGAGIRDCDVVESQRKFLKKLGIESMPEEESKLGDLKVIADLLHLTYSADQRLQILSNLWQSTSLYRKASCDALSESTHNEQGQWEKGINAIISGYL